MGLHSFDPIIAAKVGVNAAVIYQNVVFWAEKNKANGRHIKDGYVWTYNSRRAFSELFQYLSESQIKTALTKLIDAEFLVKGDYNKASYDRTNWYAPTVSAEWLQSAIGQKSPMERTEIANGLDKNRQPIPDSKPDDKPDIEDTGVSSVSNNAREIRDVLEKWAGPEAVQSFILYRRKQKGKALTLTAAKRQASQLQRIFNEGGDTDDALGMAEERGWQSVQADWYFKAKGQQHDNRTHKPAATSNGPENRADPALEQIARLAGLGQASGDAGGGAGSDGQENGPLWMGAGQRLNGS